MTQTLKEILSENKLLFTGAVIPYFLAAGLMIGAEKGMISSPDEYARRFYRAVAGWYLSDSENVSEYTAYIAIGRQVPSSGSNPGLGEGDKVQYAGRSIEVLVINTHANKAIISVNGAEGNRCIFPKGNHCTTKSAGVLTLLDVYSQNQKAYVDFAVSDYFPIQIGEEVKNNWFGPKSIKLLSVSDSKAVVEVDGKRIRALEAGERESTPDGVIVTFLGIQK